MPAPRRLVSIPGLARLLADIPRERIAALAEVWDVESTDRPGIVGALYHQMTDRDRVARAIEGLNQVEKMLFVRLSRLPSGGRAEDLAKRLPFSDDAIEGGLHALVERGLVWKVLAADRLGPRWLVPRDVTTSLGPSRRNGRVHLTGNKASTEKGVMTPPPVERVEVNALTVKSAGDARDALSTLVAAGTPGIGPGALDPKIAAFAVQCGVTLGVLERAGRSVDLGPRADRWRDLDVGQQSGALTRLWLVEDSVSNGVPPVVRIRLAGLLATLDSDVWFGVDSLARRVAGPASQPPPGESEPSTDTARLLPARSIKRDDVDRAVETLGWIGVLDCAFDSRDRPLAVRLSPTGLTALIPT